MLLRVLCRLLVLAFPAPFRDRLGRPLVQTLLADSRQRSGRLAVGRFLAGSVDVIRAGLLERWRRRNHVKAEPGSMRAGALTRGVGPELRGSWRGLVRRPVLAAGVVTTLALGIGANTAIFSVVYGVLIRPLPFPRADRLVAVWETNESAGIAKMVVAPPNLRDWRTATETFVDIGAFTVGDGTLAIDGEAVRVTVGYLSPNLFGVLGVPAEVGRTFTEADAGADVVLSDAFWRGRFGADPRVVGRRLLIGGEPHEVVGVMPASFTFPPPISFEDSRRPEPADVYVRYAWTDMADNRGAHYLTAIGRLQPDASREHADARLRAMAATLATAHADTNTGWSVRVAPLDREIVARVRPALLMLLAAVGLVLLLACTNSAHLLLARSLERHRELSVRVALGATRARLVRQLLIEGLLLAGLGGALGLLLAVWGVRLLVAAAPPSIPRLGEIRVDAPTLAVTLLCAVAAAVLSSLAPIARTLHHRSAFALRERAVTRSRGTRLAQGAILALEAGLSVILVVAAVFVGESFLHLRGTDLGFQPDRLLMFHVSLSGNRYAKGGQKIAFVESLLERLRALPGVSGAGTIDAAPLADDRQGTSFEIEGRPPFPAGHEPVINYSFVSPGYFETMGIALTRGRTFSAKDREGSELVTIINQTMARRYFAGEDPVGRSIHLGFNGDPARRIVGVVADERHESAAADPRPEAYTPVYQFPWPRFAVFVRTAGDPAALDGPVRGAVHGLDPALAVYDVSPMTVVVASSLEASRFSAWLVGAFAAMALVLALVGVYGVASHVVAGRTGELGVRAALGATPDDLLRTVLGPTLAVTAAGLSAGLLTTAAFSRVLSSLLAGVSPADPRPYIVAAGAVLVTALLAAWIPARRAARIDPLSALRAE
jgi:putative ABC transport system permease protein